MIRSSDLTTAEREYARSFVENPDDRHDRRERVRADNERLWCLLRDDPRLASVDDQRLLEFIRETSLNRIAAEVRRLAGLQVQASRRRASEPPPSGEALEEAIDRRLRLRAEGLRVERSRSLQERLRRRPRVPGEGRRFVAWMRRQRDRRGPVGDLARDMAGDRGFPRRDFEAADAYLRSCFADPLALVTLAEAWWDFIREEMEAGA